MIFFVMMGDLKALIAQLDRVQVSEACGVGSSPAERTNLIPTHTNISLKNYKNHNNSVLCCQHKQTYITIQREIIRIH